MTRDELDYLKQEAADYERHELTEDEQAEVDAEAMQANVQAWDGAKVEAKIEMDYLALADLNGTEEPF